MTIGDYHESMTIGDYHESMAISITFCD